MWNELFSPFQNLSVERIGDSGAVFSPNRVELVTSNLASEFTQQSTWCEIFHDKLLDMDEHLIEAIEVETVLLYDLEDCECCSQNSPWAFEEKQVPND